MVDDDGSIIARDWAVGFALGIGLRSKEWGECILLEHRQALVPILVYCEGELDLLPDIDSVCSNQEPQAWRIRNLHSRVVPNSITWSITSSCLQ